MKSGTTTLHQVLAKHPDVFIPGSEIHFFDIDNPLEHGDFNFYLSNDDKWLAQDMTSNHVEMWEWYHNKFVGEENKVKGEDSTTYLASSGAAERISMQEKPIKMIFALRHPTARAYSNYYHLLRTSRAVYTFEDTIRYEPHSVLKRSLYRQQLKQYFDHFPADRIHVVIFEEMIRETEQTFRAVCDFIGIDYERFPVNITDIHANKAKLPRHPVLQLRKNFFFRSFGGSHYDGQLPVTPDVQSSSLSARIANRINKSINPQKTSRPPAINPGTKAFLDEFFQRELEGIDELTGRSIMSQWFDKT